MGILTVFKDTDTNTHELYSTVGEARNHETSENTQLQTNHHDYVRNEKYSRAGILNFMGVIKN